MRNAECGVKTEEEEEKEEEEDFWLWIWDGTKSDAWKSSEGTDAGKLQI